MTNILDMILSLTIVLLLAILYFLPTIIAVASKSQHAAPVAAVNTFLGWTFLGWVGSLVWALV